LKAAARAVELYAGGPAAQRSYGAESLARVDMAVACLLTRRLDGAADSLAPVLAIPEARDLSDRIDNFVGATIVQELDRPSRAR
jgi:hypothetical protein